MKVTLIVLLVAVLSLATYVGVKYLQIGRISEGEPIGEYEKSAKALLVVDLQEDLTDPSGRHVINLEQTDRVIENANKIIRRFVDEGSLVVYIRQIHDTGPIINIFTNGALAEGSAGAKIDDRITVVGDHVFDKRIMDAFSNPELDALLIKNQIGELFITGVAADQCIDRTAKAAANRNYEVTIIGDAVGASTDEKRDMKLKEFSDLGFTVISTDDLLR